MQRTRSASAISCRLSDAARSSNLDPHSLRQPCDHEMAKSRPHLRDRCRTTLLVGINMREVALPAISETAATWYAAFAFLFHSAAAVTPARDHDVSDSGPPGYEAFWQFYYIRSDSPFAVLFSHTGPLLLLRGSRGRVVHDGRCQRGRRGSIVCGDRAEKAKMDGPKGQNNQVLGVRGIEFLRTM